MRAGAFDALLSDQPGAFLDALHHLVLPAIVLGTVPLAVIARMTRSSMLEVLSEDYVRTARAKGMTGLRPVQFGPRYPDGTARAVRDFSLADQNAMALERVNNSQPP